MARLLALLLTAGLSPDAQVVQGKPAGVFSISVPPTGNDRTVANGVVGIG
jgi:hypothetical protein